MRGNIGFTDKLHRIMVIKLLRNLKKAKNDPKINERKWMNPELLTIHVPPHMVAKIQTKINNLFDEPTEEDFQVRNDRSKTVIQERSSSRKRSSQGGSSSRKKFKKLRKRKIKDHKESQQHARAINEENALYQMASDSTKQDLIYKLEEYRAINEQLARENEELKQRLRHYEAAEMYNQYGEDAEGEVEEEVYQESL